MIALTVSLAVIPGRLEEFVTAIAMNAERSFTDEPGCLYFDVTQDVADDHHFVLYELYADDDAVAAHRAAPHFADWRAAVARCVVPGSQVNTLAVQRFHHGGEGL
ncbi:putative quinol monooxygenase [Pedococcus bigeumensis]|uniref:Antibiotic biosynthesis monooxygenase n=1 Tax=Pedococcus bigeumensis TaxID=433644 RepID=A0A502CWN8_9MICO|nr:putative quinol monooxygenase [Pedococcus bigeumensis]TPG16950.1 antibiotic biosynthesis monooxygenase [Pedococcus bigeumensis]